MKSAGKTPYRIKKGIHIGYVIFTIVATFFVFTMVRLAVAIPQLFKESSAIAFDFSHRYQSNDQRQLALIFSDIGLLNPFVFSILIYLLYGIVLFSIKAKEGNMLFITKMWINVLNISVIVFGLLITAFSVWRA